MPLIITGALRWTGSANLHRKAIYQLFARGSQDIEHDLIVFAQETLWTRLVEPQGCGPIAPRNVELDNVSGYWVRELFAAVVELQDDAEAGFIAVRVTPR